MINQQLVDYIKRTLQMGYTPDQIKTYLMQSGYQQSDIDEAFNYIYYPQQQKKVSPLSKKFNLSHKQIITIASILSSIAVIIVVSMLLFSSSNSDLPELGPADITLSISLNTPEISPGNSLVFDLSASNSGQPIQISLENNIYDLNNNLIATKSDFFYVSGKIKKPYSIALPTSLTEGTYKIESEATYDGQTSRASRTFTVSSEKPPTNPLPTETNNQTQPPPSIETCPDNCNDNNICTEDICDAGSCTNTPITPCCGNNECESSENYTSCPADCETPSQEFLEAQSTQEILDSVGNISLNNPDQAGKMCETLNKTTDIDLCYSNIASAIDRFEFCEYIQDISSKDSCLMDYAAKTKDFSVCTKIENTDLKRTCGELEGMN